MTSASNAIADRDPIKALFTVFGGVWTDPPVLQPLGLLLDLVGEAVRSRLFLVSGGPEDQALRPDFTVPITRLHVASGAAEGRFLYEGSAFRTPGPDGADAAEFPQIGAEVFGLSATPQLQDAQVAALAWRAAEAGGRGDLRMDWGDVGLFSAFLSALRLPDEARRRLVQVFNYPRALRAELNAARAPAARAGAPSRLAELLSDLPESESAKVLEELWALAGIQPVGGRSAEEITHRIAVRAAAHRSAPISSANVDLIDRYLSIADAPGPALEAVRQLAEEGGGDLKPAIELWSARLTALQALGGPKTGLILSTAFARPFSYYDGPFFEIRSLALGREAPVAAGGRYDGLPARLGGAPGAVGCAVRPDRARVEAARWAKTWCWRCRPRGV